MTSAPLPTASCTAAASASLPAGTVTPTSITRAPWSAAARMPWASRSAVLAPVLSVTPTARIRAPGAIPAKPTPGRWPAAISAARKLPCPTQSCAGSPPPDSLAARSSRPDSSPVPSATPEPSTATVTPAPWVSGQTWSGRRKVCGQGVSRLSLVEAVRQAGCCPFALASTWVTPGRVSPGAGDAEPDGAAEPDVGAAPESVADPPPDPSAHAAPAATGSSRPPTSSATVPAVAAEPGVPTRRRREPLTPGCRSAAPGGPAAAARSAPPGPPRPAWPVGRPAG